MNSIQSRAAIACVVLVAFIVGACNSAVSGNPNVGAGEGGSLRVVVSAPAARTILPTGMAVAQYRLSGTGPSGESLAVQESTTGSFTVGKLAIGDWSIAVQGLDGAGNAFLTGTATARIVSSSASVVTVSLKPRSGGTGKLTLAVSWPSSYAVDAIEASLTPDGGVAESLSFAIGGNAASCAKDGLAAGSYLVSITLKRAGSKVARTLTDVALVYGSKITEGSFSLAGRDFGEGVCVRYDGNGASSGTAPLDAGLYAEGDMAVVLGNGGALSLPGYVFTGWNTKDDGTGTDYPVGSRVILGAADAVLFAKFVPAGTFVVSGSTLVSCDSTYTGSLMVPPGVTEIAANAFAGCQWVTDVSLPAGVTSIGDNAFIGCYSLSSIILPAGLTSIGELAFNSCNSLVSVPLPEGLLSIGPGAFGSCPSLTGIRLPASVSTVSANSFDECRALTAITVDAANSTFRSVDGCLYDALGETLLDVPDGKTGSFAIPSGTKKIGECALFLSGLQEVTVPDSVTEIGESALRASGLTTLILKGSTPPTVTDGDKADAFGASDLRQVLVPSAADVTVYKAAFGNDYLASLVKCRINVIVTVE